MNPADVQATFCAALVDEWVRAGATTAIVAPGSRSTPLALAIVARPELAVHVVHDERAAAFVALGASLVGTPALLVCTSGTAAANFHPAIVEAGLSAVPMLVLTADRPAELRNVGAPQTIDQTHLYGSSVRWFHDPGVPAADTHGAWRALARRAWRAAAGESPLRAGPVHLNMPFREPLLGATGELPPPLPAEAAAAGETTAVEALESLAGDIDRQRGVIVAGARSGVSAGDIAALAAATNWPVLADPTSGVRHLDCAVPSFDALLRHGGFAADHAPDVVVRIGRPPASKVLSQWYTVAAPLVVQIGGPGTIDPEHNVVAALPPSSVAVLAGLLRGAANTTWATRWRTAAQRAEAAIAAALEAEDTLSEPGVARAVAGWLPEGAQLVVASSMPVRDLEWYGGASARAHANRGANGIDGVISTALGLALGGDTVVAIVGDIAFVHDGGALTALAGRGIDLRIVVVDNDGGGIFSFLPQAEQIAAERFERLFGTPHGTDVVALAEAHGIKARSVTTRAGLLDALAQPGPTCTRVPSDRAGNVEIHAALHRAVHDALS